MKTIFIILFSSLSLSCFSQKDTIHVYFLGRYNCNLKIYDKDSIYHNKHINNRKKYRIVILATGQEIVTDKSYLKFKCGCIKKRIRINPDKKYYYIRKRWYGVFIEATNEERLFL